MSNIDKRALREAAEKANTDNHTQDEWFHYLRCSTPETVLALLDELEAAEQRIAELEAREVKLPQRQEPTSSGHYGEGYLVPSCVGSALDYEETVEALAAAGITVKGDSE